MGPHPLLSPRASAQPPSARGPEWRPLGWRSTPSRWLSGASPRLLTPSKTPCLGGIRLELLNFVGVIADSTVRASVKWDSQPAPVASVKWDSQPAPVLL